ncbi:carboxymuconolactone decarboxylase family protein [Nocardia panacis]|nr:carboxymuconolactone decarboxylase family protein [Nocardia panacis]
MAAMSGGRAKVLGRLGLTQVRYVSPLAPGAAKGRAAQVYRQVERDFGLLAPPIALHSPAPEVMAACWLMVRETLLATGRVPRELKETIATAVSLANACPFCVTVHSGTLHGLGQTTDAALLYADRIEEIADPRQRTIARWAKGSSTESEAPPPYSAEERPEMVGATVMMHYLNRMVTIFLADLPLPPGVPKVALTPVMRALGGIIRAAATDTHPPGRALELLPAATPPHDIDWALPNPAVAVHDPALANLDPSAHNPAGFALDPGAAGRDTTAAPPDPVVRNSRPDGGGAARANPAVAEAFTRAYAAIDGVESVSAPVRELVLTELARWRGENRGLGRAWADELANRLPEGQRSAGRLALLSAFAAYQVDRSVIDAFRTDQPGDAALIELTAWAGLAAARRISTWL